MDTNNVKQDKFYVSHVWPGMIDVKCSKCGKLVANLQKRDAELVGEKEYMIKKSISCSSCNETIPEGTLIAEDEEMDRLRRESEKARRIEEARCVNETHEKMITTTCSNIEGYRIKEYRGIVSGASIYNFGGGFFAGGYSDKGQSKLFGSALETAKEILVKNAVNVGADAVIGIQTALVVTNPLIAVTLTGTAVKTEKITEDK